MPIRVEPGVETSTDDAMSIDDANTDATTADGQSATGDAPAKIDPFSSLRDKLAKKKRQALEMVCLFDLSLSVQTSKPGSRVTRAVFAEALIEWVSSPCFFCIRI
jgi:hypothetical protein